MQPLIWSSWRTDCLSIRRMLNPIALKLDQYLSLVSQRQRLTAANIANADTPGYKTVDVDFASELHSALSSAHPHAVEVPGLAVKNDGNNVSLDREARGLSENAMRYAVASNFLQGQIRAVRAAIQEGKNS